MTSHTTPAAKTTLNVTIRFSYEADPENYGNPASSPEMAEIDRKQFENDPRLLMEVMEDKGYSVEITAEESKSR